MTPIDKDLEKEEMTIEDLAQWLETNLASVVVGTV